MASELGARSGTLTGMPINYTEPEGFDSDGRRWWSNGKNPGSVRAHRRDTITMMNALAHLIYEGAKYEREQSCTSRPLPESAIWT